MATLGIGSLPDGDILATATMSSQFILATRLAGFGRQITCSGHTLKTHFRAYPLHAECAEGMS